MIILETILTLATIYVVASFFTFAWMLLKMRHSKIPERVSNNHPELKSVRRNEELLVVKFDREKGR